MSEELIDKYIDREKIKSDTDFLIAEIQRADNARLEFGTAKAKVQGGSSAKTIAEGAELGVKANAQLAESIKAVTALINQRFASEAKLITIQTDYAKATAANRLELQKQNKELKDQAALNAAGTGSIERARAAVRLLNTERNKLNLYTKEGQEQQEILNQKINKYNDFIKKSVDNLSAQKINVGNYQGSAKIIVDALEKERLKLEQLEKTRIRVQGSAAAAPFQPRTQVTGFAGGGATLSAASSEINKINAEIENSRKIIEGFGRVTAQPQFLNVAGKVGDANQELKFFTKSLIDLERNGLGSSEAANELRKQLSSLTDEIGDAKAEIKALSSDTRGFDLFAGSISFAADAFQTFAGAAVLAGASEEDAAEATKTLVAVQSVANGVKGIANELTTRGTAANKIFAFSQLQIKTAMDSTAASGARLRAVMITLGFGALIVALGLLIANFSKIKDALSGANAATKGYTETLADYKKGAQEAIEKTNSVKLAFDQAKAGVIGKDAALKIYNDTLGDTFGKATSLAEAEKLYNEKAGVYIEIMALKAQANALFAKSADEAAKGIVAVAEDQTSLFDKLRASTRQYFGDNVGALNSLLNAQRAGAKETLANSKENAQLLKEEGARIATQAELLAKGAGIKLTPPEKEKTAKKNSDDSALKDALDAEKRKAAALKALAIENANEQIRINQLVIDADGASLKEKIIALENISQQKKLIGSIEFASAVENEAKIEKGKRVEVKKSAEEILLAKQQYANKEAVINDELLKGQQAAQKANTEKIIAELEKQRLAKLALLETDTQTARNSAQKEYNDSIIALNDRFEKGAISQDKYNQKRAKLDAAYQLESLQREIDYQKQLIELSDLPADQKAAALKELSELEKQLSDATLKYIQDNEAKKTEAFLKTISDIRSASEEVFGIVGGIVDAISIGQKNKLKEESDAAEKKAARDIEIVNASTLSEQDKAAKITVINARLAAQKDQIAQKERQAEIQKAKFEKSVTIFRLTLALAEAIASLNPLKIIAASAQLGVAIATPIPKFRKGKPAGNNYEGPAIVGDGGKSEVIERADGRIEFTPATDTLTHIGRNDIIHPDKHAWQEAMLNAAHRDAHAGMRAPAMQPAENISGALDRQTKSIVYAIKNKREVIIKGASGKDIIFRDGSNSTTYLNNNLQ